MTTLPAITRVRNRALASGAGRREQQPQNARPEGLTSLVERHPPGGGLLRGGVSQRDDRRHLPGRRRRGVDLARGPPLLQKSDEQPDAPGLVLHNDGIPLRREQLLAHVASGRKRAAEVRTTVHDVATDGDVVAARYVLTAVMRKGAVIETEIFMFGRLAADGRLREMTQLTRA